MSANNDSADPLAGLGIEGLLRQGLESPRFDQLDPGAIELPDTETLTAEIDGFDFLELAGRGGMGAVYRARRQSDEAIVAVKILPRELADLPDFERRFELEAKALAVLDHPHIVKLFTSGRSRSGLPYFAMEWVNGSTLAELNRDSAMPESEAVRIFAAVCTAVAHAHERGVIHRDLKPANILIDEDGFVRVADFGLAFGEDIRGSQLSLTLSGAVLGTADFMAPEQASGEGDIDERADIFSLGVILYGMLTGKRPKGVFDPPSHAGVSRYLDGIAARAIQHDRDRRYASAAEMRAALEPGTKKHSSALAVAIGILMLVGLGIWWLEHHKSKTSTALKPNYEPSLIRAFGLTGDPSLEELSNKLNSSRLGGAIAHTYQASKNRIAFINRRGIAGFFDGRLRMITEQKEKLTQITATDATVYGLDEEGRLYWIEDGLSPMTPNKRLQKIAGGPNYLTLLTTGGEAVVFADGPDAGKSLEVMMVPSLPTLIDIDAGRQHVVALGQNGVVYSWGANQSGATDVPATFATRTVETRAIAAAGNTTFALTQQGQISVWGEGAKESQLLVEPMKDIVGIRSAAAGQAAVTLVRQNGEYVPLSGGKSGFFAPPSNLPPAAAGYNWLWSASPHLLLGGYSQ